MIICQTRLEELNGRYRGANIMSWAFNIEIVLFRNTLKGLRLIGCKLRDEGRDVKNHAKMRIEKFKPFYKSGLGLASFWTASYRHRSQKVCTIGSATSVERDIWIILRLRILVIISLKNIVGWFVNSGH